MDITQECFDMILLVVLIFRTPLNSFVVCGI
jgi:hypothetical protein